MNTLKAAWIVHSGLAPFRRCEGPRRQRAQLRLVQPDRGPLQSRPLRRSLRQASQGRRDVQPRTPSPRRQGAPRSPRQQPGSTLPILSRLAGTSTPCTCHRLGALSDAGLCSGPKCDPRARWELSAAGKALLASAADPVTLDHLERDLLTVLAGSSPSVGAWSSHRLLQLDGQEARWALGRSGPGYQRRWRKLHQHQRRSQGSRRRRAAPTLDRPQPHISRQRPRCGRAPDAQSER